MRNWLIGPISVQSRDIWDLELLFRQYPTVDVRNRLPDAVLNTAHERVFEVDYGAYRNQVVAFLEDDYAAIYDHPAEWERVQLAVAEAIVRLRSGR